MLSTLAAIDVFQRSLDNGKPLPTIASEVERETEYFRTNIGSVETVDDLMEDFRLYRYAMTAFDLSDTIDQRAIIRRVLAEDTSDSASLVNRLQDDRFREMAEAFDFNLLGNLKLTLETFADDVAEQYRIVRSEEAEGETNPGVRLAAYFLRNVDEISNWFEVLADPPLREVVFTALGIPAEVQATDVDRLAEELERRFNIADLQDPAERERFLQRFAIQHDLENSNIVGPSSAALTLLQSAANASSLASLSVNITA